MRVLVTGAAGFIGSHLCEHLLARGHEVRGVDAFTDYYDRSLKEANVAAVGASLELRRLDLAGAIPPDLLAGIDAVAHLAAQPGVRGSFGPGFDAYVARNVVATQHLLEAMSAAGVGRLVFASSSSVYGEQDRYPVAEDAPCRPHSPYGVTKLAGEALVGAYVRNGTLRAVSLRYFTVFGPRQRPDMAFARFLDALHARSPVPLYGGGLIRRDYTFVGDAVAATAAALEADVAGPLVLNVGGGNLATNGEVVAMLAELTGREARLSLEERPRGDVLETGADCRRARELLGYAPRVSLREGLAAQVAWDAARRRRAELPPSSPRG